MKIRALIAVTVLSVALMGCQTNGWSNKQFGGTLLGGALGGWAGSQIGGGTGRLAATAGGALLGALLGNSIGQSLDRADRLAAAQTTQIALETAPTGRSVSWRNPDYRRQTYGRITPRRTYQSRGRYCREYQQEITVGGRTERAYGKACRQPDGSWQIVNGEQSSYQQPDPRHVVRPRYRRTFTSRRPCYYRRFC